MTDQNWSIEWPHDGYKQLVKLDRPIQKRILSFLHQRVDLSQNPRAHGKPLSGNLSHLWCYRVGTYRMLVDIQDNKFIVIIVEV